jgi:peptidyl-prolyl cis-trans isomerase SurA
MVRIRGVLVAATIFTLSASPHEARADVLVDRIVGICGTRAITLHALKAREKPFVMQIESRESDPIKRARLIDDERKALVKRMIDELLVADAAAKLQVQVTREEIEAALSAIASSQNVTQAALMAEVARQGMTQREYRLEVERQLLEGKVFYRARPEIFQLTGTDEEKSAARERIREEWLAELRAGVRTEVRL